MAGTTAETVRQVDPEGWKKALTALEDDGDPLTAAQILNAYGFNPRYVMSPDEVTNTVKAMVEAAPEASTIARGRVKTWRETIAGAEEVFGPDLPPEAALVNAARIFGGTDRLDEHVLAMRQWLWAHAENVRKLSQLADANPENAVAVEQLGQALDTMHEFHAYLTGTSASTARALNAHKIPVGSAAGEGTSTVVHGADAGSVVRPSVVDGLTKDEVRDLARSIFMADGDPAEMLRVLRGTQATKQASRELAGDPSLSEKVRDVALSWRIEAMLSGATTHVANVVSNAVAMFQRPAEYWWAGVRSGNAELRQMGADMVAPAQLWGDVFDALGAARKALITGRNVLDASASYGARSPVDLSTIAGSDYPFRNALVASLQSPSRFLMTSDEFFKQMNYRMNVRAQILRQAREQGVTDTGELTRRLQGQGKFAFDPEGGAANPWALNYARVGTFTNPLGDGTMGARLEDAATAHPAVRLVVPFVKAPTNIFRYTWERTPLLNRFAYVTRQDLASGDPERVAIAHAKAEVGALVYAGAALLAYTKHITGAGPSDPRLRDEMHEADRWQPYSVKIGGRYVSYRRGDPIMTPFSLVADLVEMSGEMRDDELAAAPAAIMAAIASSVTSKTYMQGISDFFEAVGGRNPGGMKNLLQQTAGSFIPNALTRGNPDPVLHEVRGFLDALKARVPGFSTTLEPRRNLFGDVILKAPGYANRALNPFTVSGRVGLTDNVMNELVKLGKSIPMPPEQKDGLDLTDRETFNERKRPDGQLQSPYDRWLELIGETGLKANLSSLIESDGWAELPNDLKLTEVAGYVQAAQQEAYARMLDEYPSVQRGMEQSAEVRAAQVSGGDLDAVFAKYEKKFVRPKQR